MSLYGNSIIDYRNTQVVNEAYVGKTPTLEEIEKKIGELRENANVVKIFLAIKCCLRYDRVDPLCGILF